MNPTAKVETGRLEGLSNKAGRSGREVQAFLGVPYAADPVGPLRFRSPQAPEPWAGTRQATAFGPSPMQSASSPYSGVIPGNQVAATSEACLTLDVWTPDGGDGHRPVLVWVPGGAYLTGGTSIETYDGSGLAADEDVIVVGVNYRLGVFGFGWFGDPDLGDTNCGLRDLLAALGWIQRNAAAFGGDPANVTVFGESAGAGALAHMLASPAATGLVRRCILQSPGIDHTLYPDDMEQVADVFLRQSDLSRSQLHRLLDADAKQLLAAQEATVLEMLLGLTSMPFHPFVDGDLLTASPSIAFAEGAAAGVDLLMSWTADEMRLYPNPQADTVGSEVLGQWTRHYLTSRAGADPGPERARDLVAFYGDLLAPRGRTQGSDVWAAIQTDGVMRLPARRVADSHAGNGGRTFVAEFAWSGPPAPGEWDRGAFHAIDLPFSFDTLDRGGWRQFLGAGPEADVLARQHMHAWAAFARDGTPEIREAGAWSAYTAPERQTMVLDAPCLATPDPLADIASAWEGLWSTACRAPSLSTG
jgi:para-nitrobenzyl esterase